MHRIILTAFSFIIYLGVFAQSSDLMPGMKDSWLIDRMEIRFKNEAFRWSSKPFDRRRSVRAIETIDSAGINLSRIDRHNIFSFLASNSEWSYPKDSYKSSQPIFRHLYKNPVNTFEVKDPNFTLIFNPIFQYQYNKERDNDERIFLNSRGLAVRGVIENKVGFNFYFTENQERVPRYVNQWAAKYQSLPGIGFYKTIDATSGFDYFDLRSSISFKLFKTIDTKLAYDKNFIGSGFRSLLLSDFSNNYMHLRLKRDFGRFHYMAVFAELNKATTFAGSRVLPRKYFRAFYLGYQPVDWLSIGLFEGTMAGKERLSAGLFNPVMFLHLSSEEKSYKGLDVKVDFLKSFRLYGQLLIDRFEAGKNSSKSWQHRMGYQAGVKWIDAFRLKNLDLQFEMNRVRPFTYAASDSLRDYSHYNQPLAHPLGANFKEWLLILKAQPLKHLYIQGKLISYIQGLDIAGANFGNNVFGGLKNRTVDQISIGDGNQAKGLLAGFTVSYEIRQNLFLEGSALRRNHKTAMTGESKSNFGSIGIRLNMARREFDF